jgi:hypothetical protein
MQQEVDRASSQTPQYKVRFIGRKQGDNLDRGRHLPDIPDQLNRLIAV